MQDKNYDALIIASFGGPESRDDVIPFLENVLRGKNVPRERMLEVAEHYYQFGGKSPLNQQTRDLISALENEFKSVGIDLPVFWGNRNWHPLLTDTLRAMSERGIRRALVYVTSAYGSYSGCRQYREDIERARDEVGPHAPRVDKLRVFYNHPGFIQANADCCSLAMTELSADRRVRAHLLFTAHSIPNSMADHCDYRQQLLETARLVAERLNHLHWSLAYQSRSGPPHQPWLEPDVCDALDQLKQTSDVRDVVIAPIGFLSDHLEVLYDLDVKARQKAESLGITMIRAATVGIHPRFVEMIRELIQERLDPASPRLAIGKYGPDHDVCPPDCCRYVVSQRRPLRG